jgi:hypothetical protein
VHAILNWHLAVTTGGAVDAYQGLVWQVVTAVCMQGIQPNLLKMIPAAAIHWMAFDALKRAIGV